MRPLTLQLFNRKKWWDAAELHFDKAQMTSSVTLSYFSQYISDVLTYNAVDSWACTVNAPVTILPAEYPTWPAVLDDLLPVGKSRDWWLHYLNMARATEFEQNYALLTNACMSPVGNIRIKEAASLVRGANAQRFSTDDVARLQHDFLDYANEHGAAVGGATGAGGVAPKLLLMVDNDEVFIDADFAPMKADPEMVTRLFKWGEEYERGGIVYFDKLIQSLESFGDPDELMAFLSQLAEKLIKVPALLEKYGCPEEIIEFPAIGFNRIEKKLADFGIRHA